jgi:hypothetical protein
MATKLINLAALLVGGGVGVWGGLQDEVRGRVVEEPALVTGARAFADACTTLAASWLRSHHARKHESLWRA